MQAGSKAGPRSQLPLCPDVGAPQRLSPHVALRSSGRSTERDDAVRNVRIPLPSHPQLTCVFFFFFNPCAATFFGVPFVFLFYVCPSCFGGKKSKINIRNWSSPRASLFGGVMSPVALAPSVNMLQINKLPQSHGSVHCCDMFFSTRVLRGKENRSPYALGGMHPVLTGLCYPLVRGQV